MGMYKNSYSKKADYALWELHQIRYRIARKRKTPQQINVDAAAMIKKYGLHNVHIVNHA